MRRPRNRDLEAAVLAVLPGTPRELAERLRATAGPRWRTTPTQNVVRALRHLAADARVRCEGEEWSTVAS